MGFNDSSNCTIATTDSAAKTIGSALTFIYIFSGLFLIITGALFVIEKQARRSRHQIYRYVLSTEELNFKYEYPMLLLNWKIVWRNNATPVVWINNSPTIIHRWIKYAVADHKYLKLLFGIQTPFRSKSVRWCTLGFQWLSIIFLSTMLSIYALPKCSTYTSSESCRSVSAKLISTFSLCAWNPTGGVTGCCTLLPPKLFSELYFVPCCAIVMIATLIYFVVDTLCSHIIWWLDIERWRSRRDFGFHQERFKNPSFEWSDQDQYNLYLDFTSYMGEAIELDLVNTNLSDQLLVARKETKRVLDALKFVHPENDTRSSFLLELLLIEQTQGLESMKLSMFYYNKHATAFLPWWLYRACDYMQRKTYQAEVVQGDDSTVRRLWALLVHVTFTFSDVIMMFVLAVAFSVHSIWIWWWLSSCAESTVQVWCNLLIMSFFVDFIILESFRIQFLASASFWCGRNISSLIDQWCLQSWTHDSVQKSATAEDSRDIDGLRFHRLSSVCRVIHHDICKGLKVESFVARIRHTGNYHEQILLTVTNIIGLIAYICIYPVRNHVGAQLFHVMYSWVTIICTLIVFELSVYKPWYGALPGISWLVVIIVRFIYSSVMKRWRSLDILSSRKQLQEPRREDQIWLCMNRASWQFEIASELKQVEATKSSFPSGSETMIHDQHRRYLHQQKRSKAILKWHENPELLVQFKDSNERRPLSRRTFMYFLKWHQCRCLSSAVEQTILLFLVRKDVIACNIKSPVSEIEQLPYICKQYMNAFNVVNKLMVPTIEFYGMPPSSVHVALVESLLHKHIWREWIGLAISVSGAKEFVAQVLNVFEPVRDKNASLSDFIQWIDAPNTVVCGVGDNACVCLNLVLLWLQLWEWRCKPLWNHNSLLAPDSEMVTRNTADDEEIETNALMYNV